MKTITSLDQIRNTSSRIYVRWSKSITLDNKRGYSLKYGTSREAGLSACAIDPNWEDWRILRQMQEYQFCGGSCWIITGDEIGTGADGEELLANVALIGKAGNNLTAANWRKMELESNLADAERRLAKINDEFGKAVVARSIANYKKQLEGIK